jgi:hypothetical protein
LLNPALHCDFDVLCRRRGSGNAGLIRRRCVADYEPVTGACYKQHTVVDDKVGVILDAEVTTGQRIVQLKLGSR